MELPQWSCPSGAAALMAVINHQKQVIESAHFENTELGLKAFQKWLKIYKVSFDEHTVLVIENTGIYRYDCYGYSKQYFTYF